MLPKYNGILVPVFLLKCIIFPLPLVLETGLVTPLGIGVENVWQKLISGMCGITRIVNEGVIYSDVFIVSKYMNQFLLHNKTDCFSVFECSFILFYFYSFLLLALVLFSCFHYRLQRNTSPDR